MFKRQSVYANPFTLSFRHTMGNVFGLAEASRPLVAVPHAFETRKAPAAATLPTSTHAQAHTHAPKRACGHSPRVEVSKFRKIKLLSYEYM